jgi:hypothetical protein
MRTREDEESHRLDNGIWIVSGPAETVVLRHDRKFSLTLVLGIAQTTIEADEEDEDDE